MNKKLYSGTISSPRELQAMQADIDMLHRRRSDLEDEELEVMEQRETLDGELATLDAAIARAAGDGRGAARRRSPRPRPRSTTRSRARSRRAPMLAKPIAESLLRDYERRRAQNRGAGAARLVGTTCQACHLTIPSTEAEQIRRGAGSVVVVLRQLLRDPRPVTQDSLFGARAAPTSPARQLDEIIIYCDGGSRGNPGPSAIGAVVLDPAHRSAAAAGRGERVHRGHDEQRRRVPRAHRRARSGRAVRRARACACAPTPSSSSSR